MCKNTFFRGNSKRKIGRRELVSAKFAIFVLRIHYLMKKIPLLQIDPWLRSYADVLEQRQQRAVLAALEFTDGKLALQDCVNNHLYYGLHDHGSHWVFREKAPNACRIFMYGDFSAWQLEEQYAQIGRAHV